MLVARNDDDDIYIYIHIYIFHLSYFLLIRTFHSFQLHIFPLLVNILVKVEIIF